MSVWLLFILVGLAHTDEQDLTVTPPTQYTTEMGCYMAAKPIVLSLEKRLKEAALDHKVIKFNCKKKQYI